MTTDELFERVGADERLRGVGFNDTDNGIIAIVECVTNGLTTNFPVACLEKLTWDDLLSVLVGEREPVVLNHMTRVVGYYSRVANWSKSKIGELKARIAGRYGFEGDRSHESRQEALAVANNYM